MKTGKEDRCYIRFQAATQLSVPDAAVLTRLEDDASAYQEIYLKLPPGYEPPPGKTAKLLCSLYGLKQAQSAFHSLFKSWLLCYGFTAIGGDRVTFLLCCGTSVVLLSIYVDDGIAATNDEK
eukprot:52438-Rhodomonas_salina.1